MRATILVGDVLARLADIEPESIQCCVTSPPYWGLRDYGEPGQLGLEATPDEYVAKMVEVFRDVRRVLRDDGTLFLNLGDSYAGAPVSGWREGSARADGDVRGDGASSRRNRNGTGAVPGLKPKDLVGIPWRVALALQADGWWLRSDIIWHKRSCMPESVTDRPTRCHEYVFLLTKSARYFWDADAVREGESSPEQTAHNQRYAKEYKAHTDRVGTTGQPGNVNNAGIHSRPGKPGRNVRTVWTINPRPFSEAHFATFPPELPERCIRAGSKEGDTVLDPFGGAGTTGLVANRLGRHATLIELNPEYAEMARKRIHGDAPMFNEVEVRGAS